MNDALQDEEKRIRILRFVVDLNLAILMQQADLTLREAFEIMKNTKKAALNLFPDKEIISERFVIVGGRSNKG
jgi:hypothetical protein